MNGPVRPAVDSPESARDLLARLTELFESPALYPAQLDLERGTLGFVPVERETYRALSFHSSRWLKELTPHAIHLPTATLLRRLDRQRPAPAPPHFILHPAFCGSTLLSRALEVGTRSLAFREPDVLHVLQTKLAKAREAGSSTPELERLLGLTLHLLGRHYPDQDGTIVKTTDAASLALDALFTAPAGSRAVFLYMDPPSFVASAIKSEERRDWLRKRAAWLELPLFRGLTGGEPPDHRSPPARIAVALWIGHARAVRTVLEGDQASRLRTLQTEAFLAEPSHTICGVARFFGLQVADGLDGRLAPELGEHAKIGGAYTPADRATELGQLRDRYRAEIRDALGWATRAFGPEALDTALPAPLLG